MFAIHNYSGFIAAILLFQLIPGPGALAILNATARNGITEGMGAVVGTLLGDLLFMLAAVLGLAALLAAYPVVLSSLQWIGIFYLCRIGLKLLRSPIACQASVQTQSRDFWKCLRQAFAVCLTNPKAIMFFMAFFPLFIKTEPQPFTLAMMVAHVTCISLLYQTGLVLIGNAVAVRLAGFKYARLVATRLAGAALIGFGIKLAINER